MNDNSLDPRIESLLESEALWESPSPHVQSMFLAVTSPRPKRRMPWIVGLAASAALVLGFLALSNEEADWTLDIEATTATRVSGQILGFNERTGTRLVLEIDDLPPAQSGTFYEVWWIRDGGEAVSSGSFLESDTIEMWMGIRRKRFSHDAHHNRAKRRQPIPKHQHRGSSRVTDAPT